MKKVFVLVMALTALSFAAHAQCEKKMKWVASKMEFLDKEGNSLRDNDESIEVTTFGKEKVSIVATSGDEEMMGVITDYVCNWADKDNGKITFKSELTDKQGITRHATITIEAVNGKTNILLEAEEEDSAIRLPVDSFEEVK